MQSNSKVEPETPKLLHGRRIVVTRAREQAGNVLAQLSELGAEAIPFPVIKIVPPETWEEMDGAVAELSSYNWVIFTSVNGVEYFWRRLEAAGKDSHAFDGIKTAAIGPATAAVLEEHGLKPTMIPGKYVAEAILDKLEENLSGRRFLLPRADIAREALVEGLQERGAYVRQVSAYRTVVAGNEEEGSISATTLVGQLEAGEIDLVTFTSSSTVRNFAARLSTASSKALPELLRNCVVACIGPVTAGTARQAGLKVDLEAGEFTMDGLVDGIVNYFSRQPVNT